MLIVEITYAERCTGIRRKVQNFFETFAPTASINLSIPIPRSDGLYGSPNTFFRVRRVVDLGPPFGQRFLLQCYRWMSVISRRSLRGPVRLAFLSTIVPSSSPDLVLPCARLFLTSMISCKSLRGPDTAPFDHLRYIPVFPITPHLLEWLV